MMAFAWKVLKPDGSAYHGGTGKWSLPKGGKPGGWQTVRGPLVPCRNGLHLCRREDLVHWLGPAIFVAEYDGDPVADAHKIVVRRARLVSHVMTWNDRTARLFAADCADRLLWMVAKRGLTVDNRSKAAAKAARDFANGKIGSEELAAARAAARDAASDAAGAAARDAVWAAAGAAVWAAARDAASDAAGAAAGAAAWAAAWAAARDAAWAAARDAASDAAGAAAGAAVWAAECKWQTGRLHEYLTGKRGA